MLLLAYAVWSIMLMDTNSSKVALKSVDVTLVDSGKVDFITNREVASLITRGLYSLGTPMEDVELRLVDSVLRANEYLQEVRAWTTIEGEIKVIAESRVPEFRVVDQGGWDFYVDSTLVHLMQPRRGYCPDVPTLSTNINFSLPTDYGGKLSEKNYEKDLVFIKKLATFVECMHSHTVLQALSGQLFVEQVGEGLEVDIVPEQENSVILLGLIDRNIQSRIQSVENFYTQAYTYARLDTAQVVDARFRGQILVR